MNNRPPQTNGHEPAFQVEGTIDYSSGLHCPPGTETIKHSRHFVVARKGPQWKIRTTNLKEDGVAHGDEYDEMGCDGTKICELKSFDENNPEISNIKSITTAQGRVRRGTTLVGLEMDLFYPLWIAYCSSNHFLSRKDNRIAAPLFIMGDNLLDTVPPPFALPAEWKLNGSNFISEITWQSEGMELGVENGTDNRLQYRLHELPAPFNSGFLRASFETTDWVDFNGMQLPGSFAVKIFFPDQTTGKFDVSYAVDAKAQAVQTLHNFSFLPELTKKTRITDTRYRLGTSLGTFPTYASLTWMTEEEVEAKCKSLGMEYEKQKSQS